MGEIADFVQVYIKDSDILAKETDTLSQLLENNIKAEAPYDKVRLRESIRVVSEVGEDHAVIIGTYDEGIAPHGDYVLMGTNPHIIEGNPYLSWKGASHPVRRVHHPGTKPNDFLGRGLTGALEAYK